MNKPNLSDIYRNGLRQNENGRVLDADAVIAIANGEAKSDNGAIAASPMQADLVRFSRELEVESAALSSQVTALLGDNNAMHRRGTAHRAAHGQRRWRIASAMAAGLMAAVAIWTSQRISSPHHEPAMASVQAPDRIFSALSGDSVASISVRGDEIFNSTERGDVIFSAGHNGG